MTLLFFMLFAFAESLPLSQIVKQTECAKFQSAYQTFCSSETRQISVPVAQGRPGKRGPIGQKGGKGERGIRGEKGEEGQVDYDAIEAMVERKLERVREEHTRNYTEMKQLLEQERKKVESLQRTDICPVNYEGKCFWLESKKQPFDQMEALCESRGGKVANIYSEFHHYMITGYLRTKVDRGGYTDAAVGLTYKGNRVALTNGTAAPYVKWYSGYPRNNRGPCLLLIVREPWNSPNQHLYQYDCGGSPRGVICERQYIP